MQFPEIFRTKQGGKVKFVESNILSIVKELHLFYAPEATSSGILPPDEAIHAVRVLRMREGDSIHLTDGEGHFFTGHITQCSQKSCQFEIDTCETVLPHWDGNIQIAVAPTKNIDRMEWFAEKAVEIGCDRITFLSCQNSERHVLKSERIEKIVISAMKQSHKAVLPQVDGLLTFRDYVAEPFDGVRCIAHCYADSDVGTAKRNLFDLVEKGRAVQVLVGPEGDFSLEEVHTALSAGFIPVSLGESRLRTETAALVATHIMNLKMTLS
ncbi:MAG: 16S rRNA (uracil(1498)-N(3))-methyltransferase [Alloprevotella sp.]|nr:16S rRNA (uracil(1498)-N(3))-methyltransferase [Alloprevotella sp.]